MKARTSHLLALLWLAGCSSAIEQPQYTQEPQYAPALSTGTNTNEGRYSIAQDHAPAWAPDIDQVPLPTPRYEPYSAGGNRHYHVFGQPYQVLPSAQGYDKIGIASWYGQKFHGHLTSNGETYDMFTFTAAHKSLPLPAYAKVTNLENNRTIIVRINDRGPFHNNREIDLSYAAAHRLGMLEAGTAQVRVQTISFPDANSYGAIAGEPHSRVNPGPRLMYGEEGYDPAESSNIRHYIQLLAGSNQHSIHDIGYKLTQQYAVPSRVTHQSGLYRLQLGPIASLGQARSLLQQLRSQGYPEAFSLME